MDLTALQAETRRLVGETSTHWFTPEDIDAELNRANEILMRHLPEDLISSSLITDQSVTQIATQSTYTRPPEHERMIYVKIYGVYADKTDFNRDTELKTNNFMIPKQTRPLWAPHHGNKFEVYPIPAMDGVFTVTGVKKPTPLTLPTHIPPYVEDIHYLLAVYAAGRCLEKDKKWEAANRFIDPRSGEFWTTIDRLTAKGRQFFPGLGRRMTPGEPAPVNPPVE